MGSPIRPPHCVFRNQKETENMFYSEFELAIVEQGEYGLGLGFASVTQLRRDETWMDQIPNNATATLSDGKCQGSDFGFRITQEAPDYGKSHKVLVRYFDKPSGLARIFLPIILLLL